MENPPDFEFPTILAKKQVLAVDRLVLQIHDASFPADVEEDVGRGSPYSGGAQRFFAWVAELGFDAIQLGPRGMTSRGNASPYDATIFSRNPLDLPLLKFVKQGRLSRATWESLRGSLPPLEQGIVPYGQVFNIYERALVEIVATAQASDRAAAREFLAVHEAWLIPDSLYGVLCREHGSGTWREWNRTSQGAFDQHLFSPPQGLEMRAAERLASLCDEHAKAIEGYSLIQWLLVQEHRELRERLTKLGLAIYGDLQVGLSHQDTWAWNRLFLPGYRMGAPPSRTTPLGQPWGYAVLNPRLFGTTQKPGPALAFVRARIERVLGECDGLRVDHPHGWIDPWVYLADHSDPFLAVQSGARLFSSPDNPHHPQLSQYAIARPEQIDRSQLLHADGHVTDLDAEQVERYSILVDEIVSQQTSRGQAPQALACEVLSTLPYPVSRVLDRHKLGRFRVTQKINLAEPADVYRIENARPQDWIMLGTHDTPPIWEVAKRWCCGPEGQAWGLYLAERLTAPNRSTFAAEVAGNHGRLVNACFAAMLASQARHVVVFFPDLFGMTARYNEPGVVSDANWSLRVPAGFEEFYEAQLKMGLALDLNFCFQLASGGVPQIISS